MIVDSIRFKGHTCFKTGWSGFDTVKPINVIIGRNNSGKSHLLDLVDALCCGTFHSRAWQYRCEGSLDETSLKRCFDATTSEGELGGNHWHDHGRHFVDARVAWETDQRGGTLGLEFLGGYRPESPLGERSTAARLKEIREVVVAKKHRLTGKSLRRLLADRDIEAEAPTVKLSLGPSGRGASNIVRRFLTTANEAFSRELIQRDLRDALNRIFGPDGEFTEIQVKEHDENGASDGGNHWEIYLGERGKGLVPLSRSGSGLKTVLLVLLNLLVVPELGNDERDKDKSRFVFAFEELENDLHPALLRRLFQYLEQYALEERATIFLTTHSSTALDFFGTSGNAQIIRVSHDGESAHAEPIRAHFDRLGVVSELGARPSDLLLANGIVWLEGPSDRVYLNRWIELCSSGVLREGRAYQCAFYGGSLLARAQFASPDAADAELANLLQVNPNVVVVCDSDRAFKGAALKDRVRRIRDEVARLPDAHIWITGAREIENYVPGAVLGQALSKPHLPDPGQFESFFPRARSRRQSYVEGLLKEKHRDKMDLAISVAPHMTRAVMESRFDWREQMEKIVECIESWNGLRS